MTNLISLGAAAGRGFLNWWLTELIGLVPKGVRGRLAAGKEIYLFEVTESDFGVFRREGRFCRADRRLSRAFFDKPGVARALRKRMENRGRSGASFGLYLPVERGLRKTLVLPNMTEPDLGDMIRNQIERQTPFHPDDVYYGYETRRQDQGDRGQADQDMQVVLTVVRKATVDDAVRVLAAGGIRLEFVGMVDGEGGIVARIALPTDDRPRRARANRGYYRIAKLGLGTAAAALAVYLPLHVQSGRIAGLQEQIAALRPKSEVAFALRAQFESIGEDRRFISEARGKSPYLLEILNELARILPDESWLDQFRARGRDIQVSGYSPSAPALIPVIDASPMFGTPSFDSPVTRQANQQAEKFSIQFQVEARK
jgi:general secretion pathway protein L